MFGVAPAEPGSRRLGWAWLLSSEKLDFFKRDAWVLSEAYVDEMVDHYDTLANFIDYRNIRSLRWLERLGFIPLEVQPEFGVERGGR